MKSMISREGTDSRSTRRGSVLIPALLAVLLTSGLCVCYLQLSLSKSRESQVSVDAKSAFYVAEAGLAEAYYGLARGMQGAVASESVPARFGNGVYWVTCEDLGDRVTLRSTGLTRKGRAAVSATLRKGTLSVASLGMYGNQSVDLRKGSRVDAYDSTVGPYESPKVASPGGGSALDARVGCNGSINLAGGSEYSPGATIVGDANPGPSGTVVIGMEAIVTGSTAPATQTTTLPTLHIELPEEEPLEPTAGTPVHLPAGSYAWSKMHLGPNSLVHITGPADVVLDELVLDHGSRLEIDGSLGAVEISVRSYVNMVAGSVFTTLSQGTDRASLLTSASLSVDRDRDGIADPPVTLAATGPFYGLIYAPRAPVVLPASFTVYGSVVADRITLGNNARLHFDRALLNSTVGGTLPEFLCWRVVELPPSRLVDFGFDPLTVLKVNSVVPVAPQDAHYVKGVAPDTSLRTWLAPVTEILW